MFMLKTKMALLLAVMFGIVYAIVVVVGTSMGVSNFYFYIVIALGFMFIQFLVGPKIVEWSMRIKYIQRDDNPRLYAMIEDQAQKAGIPMPRVGISRMQIPNAFAFGRGIRDGRVCVTEGIMNFLNGEELKAVIGHEISHIKNRDVLTITLLSVIPMVMYRIAWYFLFWGSFSNRRRDGGNTVLIGMAAFLFYFVTNLLVLYASRIREYFADRGSIMLGNRPEVLATALYKLVYGSARLPKEQVREAEGLKAFFLNDPSRAHNEIKELGQLDLDRNGSIDASELMVLRNKTINLRSSDKMMELLSTHPNMLKRIKMLSEVNY